VSPIYYRTKAAYVLWMLRSVAGDKPLQAALQAYNPAQDTSPAYFEDLLEKASGQDLHWFFQNWVDQDPGLPDLAIGGVYPSPEGQQQVLVAVDIINNGFAEADVPLTVKSADASLTDWVRVPAHGRITHRVTLHENPIEVDLNDGSVPEVQDSIHQKLINEAPPS
jgi:aminopeptidase N